MLPDPRQCALAATNYTFVDKLAVLEWSVAGAANQARFRYWLRSFQYMRGLARLECAWALYTAAETRVKAIKNRGLQILVARAILFPARANVVRTPSPSPPCV